MAAITKLLPAEEQPGNPLPALNSQQKESLIMMIVLNYADEHGLLNEEQLADARASLRALFLRATGEETMLRKLIGILSINRTLNKTFSDMAHILEGIHKSNSALVNKHETLTRQLADMAISPEENTAFIGPLLEFATRFLSTVNEFDRQMTEYRDAKEAEARGAHIFRLAQEARERLKLRFEEGASGDSRQEQQVKQKVIQTFNYSEAESEYHFARRSARRISKEVEGLLMEFQLICQMAMKPDMRNPSATRPAAGQASITDIHSLIVQGVETFPRLRALLPVAQDLLRLYQRSYGLFLLDFDKFHKALGPMIENTVDYFHAKDQDEDVRIKQIKLERIEALIAYIEDASQLLRDGQAYIFPRFSKIVSAHIMRVGAKWSAIAEPLLQMKVVAEAELSTQLA
jgi:hypothetical protein